MTLPDPSRVPGAEPLSETQLLALSTYADDEYQPLAYRQMFQSALSELLALRVERTAALASGEVQAPCTGCPGTGRAGLGDCTVCQGRGYMTPQPDVEALKLVDLLPQAGCRIYTEPDAGATCYESKWDAESCCARCVGLKLAWVPPAPQSPVAERLCVDCGALPADECFTVCTPCWEKAYPKPAAQARSAGRVEVGWEVPALAYVKQRLPGYPGIGYCYECTADSTFDHPHRHDCLAGQFVAALQRARETGDKS